MVNETKTLIIGASAAGLATAATVHNAGQPYELVEATDAVGTAWRHHYDRLHLHTPKSASCLPGLPMPAEWPRYPSRDQVVEYLERYRAHHCIEPHHGEEVTNLEQVDGGWLATTPTTDWYTRNVVVATGATRRPVRPTWEGMEQYTGDVLHSSEYCNGARWHHQPVLVVGFGNSACEQAIDLVEHGALTHMSVRGGVNIVPREILGVPILKLGAVMRRLPSSLADALAAPLVRLTIGDIRKVGLQKLPYGPNSQIANHRQIPLLDIGTMDHVRAGRITLHGGIERFTPTGVDFTDGTSLDVAAVILGTGYRPALDEFLPAWRDVCDADGRPLVSGAPTSLPGLFFCGQFVSPAGMLREIGTEARRIARALTSR